MKLIEMDDRIALHAQQQVPLVAVHPFCTGVIQSFARVFHAFSITVSTGISTYRHSLPLLPWSLVRTHFIGTA